MTDPLQQPASMERLHALRDADVLEAEHWEEAVRLAHAPAAPELWRIALDRLGLFLGAGLTLSGIAYFFAFNWAELTLEARLGLIHLPLGLALLLGGWRGFGTTVGQVCLLSASVLFGVGQVVISQEYQTGADPWTLFALYCVVTLPWALAARFAANWLLWLTALSLALGMAWVQYVGDRPGWMLLCLAVVPAGAWFACQVPVLQKLGLSGAWLPRAASTAAVVLLLAPAVMNVFEFERAGLLATLLLIGLGGGATVRAVVSRPDLFDLAVLGVAFVVWSAAVMGRMLFDHVDAGALGALLIGGVIVVEVAVMAGGLRALSRRAVVA